MRPRERRTTSLLLCLATVMASLWTAPTVAAALSFGPSAEEASDVGSSRTTVERGTVPDPPRSVTDMGSGASDAVSDLLPTPTPSISDATDPIADAIGDAADAVSGATSGAAGTASGAGADAAGAARGATSRGVGPAAPAGAQTSAREGRNPSGCASGACGRPDSRDSLGRTIERILGFLAETGSTLLPWIALAAGLGVLGVVLVRASRRRTSRT